MEREKALEMALGQIEKQYGKGAIMRMDEQSKVKIAAIPTGALSLDLALGIGGLPRGRVVEIYGAEASGKTSLALHCVAEAQKAGGIAAFIDAEHALDPSYAKAIGVDVEALLVSQPDNGEQALEIADMLIRSGAIDILVIDSVAALTPRAEIEGEMGDTHVGLQARLMSQALRKLAGTLNRSKTCAVFINQIREKVGVLFGCFSGNARITLADGTQEKIGEIVNQRLPVEVLSYDPEFGRVVPKKVTNWFNNGPTEEFLTIRVARGDGTGRSQFSCTPNHQIRTPAGWKEAQELQVGDRVLHSVQHYLSDFQWAVLLGGLMGDGALSPTRSGYSARYRFGHGEEQTAYADWKASLFANIGSSRSTNAKGSVFYDFRPLPELAELREAVYLGRKKVLSHDYLKRLTPLTLAIWYMDDASFQIHSLGVRATTRGGTGRADICVEAFDPGSQRRLQQHLRDEWGIDSMLSLRGGKATLQFPTPETDKLQALIAPYVHPSMDYKLLPCHRGKFAVESVFAEPRWELAAMPIVSIERTPRLTDGCTTHRYDIEVDGTHNYFVDGVMVHNSPETQPGGRALKFYSSVRLDVRRIESLKDGTDFVGNRVRVKVVKNKCVAEGTRVFDPTTGLTHRIEDIVDRGEATHVWAVDKKGQFHIRSIYARFDQGEQEVIGLRLRNGNELRVTPDHLVLTETGWCKAGELRPGDRVARPRRVGGFGDNRPVTVDQARMLGYLIGDGSLNAATPIALVNTSDGLQEDARRIAADLGCETSYTHPSGIYASFSSSGGKKNRLLALARWAGIYGCLAPDKKIPGALLAADIAEDVIANLLFGIWESDGWISREQTGGIRVGFVTTSEQLAGQIHWMLLRWGIGNSVRVQAPRQGGTVKGRRIKGKHPCWHVRVSGIDNVRRFAEALPMWGPKGEKLTAELAKPALGRRRGARTVYLPAGCRGPILEYLERHGVTGAMAASILGLPPSYMRAGLRNVLGRERMRRDRVEKLAKVLDSQFLRDILSDDLYYERIHEITPPRRERTFDIAVEDFHNFVAEDVVVHNCSPPFKQAEFDILFGEGISREGSILDMGVEHGIVKKAGAWYTYEGEQLGQGRENARQFLKEHDDVAGEIYKKVTEHLGLVPTDVTGEDPEDADDADA